MLLGIAGEGSLSMLSSGSMKKMLKKGQAIVAHLFMMNMMTNSEEEVCDNPLGIHIFRYCLCRGRPFALFNPLLLACSLKGESNL